MHRRRRVAPATLAVRSGRRIHPSLGIPPRGRARQCATAKGPTGRPPQGGVVAAPHGHRQSTGRPRRPASHGDSAPEPETNRKAEARPGMAPHNGAWTDASGQQRRRPAGCTADRNQTRARVRPLRSRRPRQRAGRKRVPDRRAVRRLQQAPTAPVGALGLAQNRANTGCPRDRPKPGCGGGSTAPSRRGGCSKRTSVPNGSPCAAIRLSKPAPAALHQSG